MIRNFLLCILVTSSALFHSQSWSYYYGTMHSQTSYSDGNQDSSTSLMTKPWQAYAYAKLSQNINFYGISDHNHVSAGMTNKTHYHMGVADANNANIDGTFVAMYGMEWGVISGGGHVLVYGIDSLIGWDNNVYDIYVAQSDYSGLWSKINARPAAFALLAHPQSGDYNNLLTSSLNSNADNAIVGLPARSGPAFSTNNSYSDPSNGNYITRYREGLSQGFHIGISLDHDTHNSVFGRQTKGRTVVLAPALTRYALMYAFKKMRFYSSDDWNVKVNFNIHSQPMGSVFTYSTDPTLNISISDPDAETTSSLVIYYGVPGSAVLSTALTSTSSANNFTYTHSISNNSTYYYYLEITQADGDKIWTSPIWYTKNASFASNPPVTSFTLPSVICTGQSITLSDNSGNSPNYWNWTMLGANTNTSVLQSPAISYSAAGIYTITLLVTNNAGTGIPFSQTLTVNACPTSVSEFSVEKILKLFPNPGNDYINIEINEPLKNAQIEIYNSLGEKTETKSMTTNYCTLDLRYYADGLYFIHLVNDEKTSAKGKFMKLEK